jgi:hypothetical protein
MALTTYVVALVVATVIALALKMVGFYPGGFRGEALDRLTVGQLWLIIATPLFVIWFIVGLVLAALDMFVQLVFGTEAVMTMNLHSQALGWYVESIEWFFYGAESFDPLPYA